MKFLDMTSLVLVNGTLNDFAILFVNEPEPWLGCFFGHRN